MNSFGRILRLTTWGESHGKAIGGVLDGCPPGIHINPELIQKDLLRRRPGQSDLSSPRNEPDDFELMSGLLNSVTTGQPIAFIIHNRDQVSKDYSAISEAFRPSHADYTYYKKYGIHDKNGGGRSSARETASWVLAAAIARQVLAAYKIDVYAFVKSIGNISTAQNFGDINRSLIESNAVRCPDVEKAQQMESYVRQLKEDGNTCGGMIQCVIEGLPAGLGEPVFDKFNARLAQAMLTINAARAFELGDGIEMSTKTGFEVNDSFEVKDGLIQTTTNHSAGIQGGISNGMPVWFQVYFKPVSSIKTLQQTVDISNREVSIKIEGRHDPCVVPRAVPIVEAMAILVCTDFILLNQTHKING